LDKVSTIRFEIDQKHLYEEDYMVKTVRKKACGNECIWK